VHELRSNQENDLQTFYQKENFHSKTVESMNFQLANLKNALGTLADVVSEEIEHIRRVVISGEVEQKIVQANIRMEQLASMVNRQENEVSKYSYDIEALKDEVMTLRAIDGRRSDLLEKDLDEKLKEIRKENKNSIEEIKNKMS